MASSAGTRVRPQAPWYPLPLSELLIVVGAIAITIGLLSGGPAKAAPALIAGVLAVAIGTVEVTLREHLSGFRSHAVLLALVPVIVFHTAAIFIVSAFAPFPRAANIALLAVDLGLFLFLFRFLRSRYVDARVRSVAQAGAARGAPTAGRTARGGPPGRSA